MMTIGGWAHTMWFKVFIDKRVTGLTNESYRTTVFRKDGINYFASNRRLGAQIHWRRRSHIKDDERS